jgi:hypothetical protein
MDNLRVALGTLTLGLLASLMAFTALAPVPLGPADEAVAVASCSQVAADRCADRA